MRRCVGATWSIHSHNKYSADVDLAPRLRAAYFDRTVNSSIVISIISAVLLLCALVALTARRRVRANNRFELGSVSQQWLLGHKGDER